MYGMRILSVLLGLLLRLRSGGEVEASLLERILQEEVQWL
jgi:hypothetical protein